LTNGVSASEETIRREIEKLQRLIRQAGRGQ
jgi:hypothetical protein